MHASMVKPQDAVIVSVLAAVLALGLTLATPTIGLQVVFGFLIVLVAFTSVPASLFLLIGSMLLSPEIAVGRVEGRGVGARELSLRVDDLLLVIIGFSWLVKTDHLSRSSPHSRDADQSPHRLLHAGLCACNADRRHRRSRPPADWFLFYSEIF